MNVLLHAFVADPLPASVGSLAISLVYEDAVTHRRAMAVHEFLLQQLDENASMHATWWNTSLLVDPKVYHAASKAIGNSDLIVLAVDAEQPPSPGFQSWIEAWTMRAVPQVRLVALLDGQNDANRAEWDNYLRGVASRKNLVYLAGSTDAITGTYARTAGLERIQVGAPGKTVTRYIESYVHGGLNE